MCTAEVRALEPRLTRGDGDHCIDACFQGIGALKKDQWKGLSCGRVPLGGAAQAVEMEYRVLAGVLLVANILLLISTQFVSFHHIRGNDAAPAVVVLQGGAEGRYTFSQAMPRKLDGRREESTREWISGEGDERKLWHALSTPENSDLQGVIPVREHVATPERTAGLEEPSANAERVGSELRSGMILNSEASVPRERTGGDVGGRNSGKALDRDWLAEAEALYSESVVAWRGTRSDAADESRSREYDVYLSHTGEEARVSVRGGEGGAGGSKHELQPWCLEVPARKATEDDPYFLVAIVYVRIRTDDFPELSRLDLLHWLSYYRYAGVDHVYVYDCRVGDDESLQEALRPATESNFVTLVDFHGVARAFVESGLPQGNHRNEVQLPAKRHAYAHYGHEFDWAVLMDMDEYPFSAVDQEPGFLRRFLESGSPDVTAHEVRNFVMFGLRNYTRGDMLLEQVPYVTKREFNRLSKPIMRSEFASTFAVIHKAMTTGRVATPPGPMLRMNHVWGGRYSQKDKPNWVEEIPPELAKDLQPIDLSNIVRRQRVLASEQQGMLPERTVAQLRGCG